MNSLVVLPTNKCMDSFL